MNQPDSPETRLLSVQRIASLLFSISALSGLAVLLLKWLNVFDAERFWAVVFCPLMILSSATDFIIKRHIDNVWLVVVKLADLRLLPPLFGRYLAACIADWLILGAFVLLPVVTIIAQTSGWISQRAVAGEAWLPWMLALAVGWIVVATVPMYAYVFWLPTTRLQARPGFWLLGLRMTDFEGNRLTRRALHSKPSANPADPEAEGDEDAEVEEPPAYLIIRRPAADKNQLKLEGNEK